MRFGQCLHIGLSVWCHRHFLQLEISRWHHVLGKTIRYFCLESIGGNLTVGGIVSAKMFLIVQLTDKNNHLLHTFHLQHDILDFAQFDTQTAQLNLMVGTTENHYVAIRQPLGVITRLINTFTMIVNESFFRHLLKVVVATSNTTTADI